jgi:hypothetical protein
LIQISNIKHFNFDLIFSLRKTRPSPTSSFSFPKQMLVIVHERQNILFRHPDHSVSTCVLQQYINTGPMRSGFNRYIGEPRRAPWISEGPHSRSQWRFTWIFFIFCLLLFGFSPQILNFEKGFSLSPGPKAVLFHLGKFLLEALRK